MDPRAKIISMIIMLSVIFLVSNLIVYLFLSVIIAYLLISSKIKLLSILKTLRPFFLMMIFLLILNSYFIRDGKLLLDLNFFILYSEALIRTSFILIRIVLMISLTTILTTSTKPVDLTLAIEKLLEPLKRFNFPSHEIAMMISISLRFIPILMEETQRIMKAQASRGVDFENAKIKAKIAAMVSLIIPLFVSSFNRADELANAMEARGYHPQGQRTRLYELNWASKDTCMVILSLLLFVLVFVYEFII